MYKALWSRIARRPWTFIMRDSYHKRPAPWLLGALLLGYLGGHLFWGKKWIENEGR
jgi:hypothetical protein